jgi:REP element-mobilizing transposase RayT
MTLARKYLISPDDTPYYHVMTRCVRRAFLCGIDKFSGTNYEHRRKMIVDRIKSLALVFNIDVCAYAVMSNHYHLVLKINSTKNWNEKQVLAYWSQLCTPKPLCQKFLKGEQLSKAELELVYLQTDIYRKRLMSISWYMKMLNEYIAKKANLEDKITGCFFESRFKSQALLDERALLSCMAYVDLNPIRAAMARTPENSDHTSIQERIKNKSTNLLNFGSKKNDIPYNLNDYLDLVDSAGRALLTNKKGFIPDDLPPIMDRLGFDGSTWFDDLDQFKFKHKKAIGTAQQLKNFIENIKKKIKQNVSLIPQLE